MFRRLRGGCAGAWLFLLSGTAYATDTAEVRADLRTSSCGFPFAAGEVASARGGVPLVFEPLALDAETASHIASHRERLLEEQRRRPTDCTHSEAYVRSIVRKLVSASALERFAETAPSLTVVFQCAAAVPLPVARASVGNVIVVPGALTRLSRTEDAIAAVLAHELSHLSLRHAERFLRAQTNGLTEDKLQALKREHEREADITGLALLAQAGYDPRAAVEHLRLVDELAHARRPGRDRRDPLHDQVDVRVEHLERQRRACAYRDASPRPVLAAVQKELERAASGRPGRPRSDHENGYFVGSGREEEPSPGVSRLRQLAWGAANLRRENGCMLEAPP